MTPGELLATLEGRGIELFVADGFFRYKAPTGGFNTSLREEARRLRPVLLTEWMCPRCLHIDRAFYGFHPNICCRRCL